MKYERLLIWDGIATACHFIGFLILSLSGIMWVTICLIRVPRMVLHVLALKKKEFKWQNYEYLFRKYSTFAFAPTAWIMQLINCMAYYCTDWSPRLALRMLQATTPVLVV